MVVSEESWSSGEDTTRGGDGDDDKEGTPIKGVEDE